MATTQAGTRVAMDRMSAVRARSSLLAISVVAVTTALVDALGHPAGGQAHLHSAADWVFTALLIPFALGPLVALSALHRAQEGRDGAAGKAGYLTAAAAMVGFIAAGAITLVTRNPNAVGPLYPLSMLASLLGLITMSVASVRARVLPRWILPAVTAGWFFGGPIAEGGQGPFGFRGAAVILALVCILAAVALWDRPRTSN